MFRKPTHSASPHSIYIYVPLKMAFAIPMKRDFMIDSCCPEHSVSCLWLDSTRFVAYVHREFSSVPHHCALHLAWREGCCFDCVAMIPVKPGGKIVTVWSLNAVTRYMKYDFVGEQVRLWMFIFWIYWINVFFYNSTSEEERENLSSRRDANLWRCSPRRQ